MALVKSATWEDSEEVGAGFCGAKNWKKSVGGQVFILEINKRKTCATTRKLTKLQKDKQCSS